MDRIVMRLKDDSRKYKDGKGGRNKLRVVCALYPGQQASKETERS